MPFAPVGSLGDVIALVLIVRDLIQAFDKLGGSSAEYQAIMRTLRTFNLVVQEVETLCSTFEDTAELNAVRDVMCATACQSRCITESFLRKVRRFEPNLRAGGSGNRVKDAARKAQWRLFCSDDSIRFQSEIDVYCSMLSALISTANV